MARKNDTANSTGCAAMYSFDSIDDAEKAVEETGIKYKIKAVECPKCGKAHIVDKIDEAKAVSTSAKLPGYGKVRGMK